MVDPDSLRRRRELPGRGIDVGVAVAPNMTWACRGKTRLGDRAVRKDAEDAEAGQSVQATRFEIDDGGPGGDVNGSTRARWNARRSGKAQTSKQAPQRR